MASGVKLGGMLEAMTDEQGLDAFDAAVRMNGDEAVIMPLLLHGGSVESFTLFRQDQKLLLDEVHVAPDKHVPWLEQLAFMESSEDRLATILDLVLAEMAKMLGYQMGDTLPNHPFTDLGMDAFTAVQLRNKLSVMTGLK